jgi:hypothetical protein
MNLTNTALQPSPYEPLMTLPENLVGEVIDGELYVQPRPAGRQAVAESAINVELGGPFGKGRGGPGGWWILVEPIDTLADLPGILGIQ